MELLNKQHFLEKSSDLGAKQLQSRQYWKNHPYTNFSIIIVNMGMKISAPKGIK
jgi:hypothetical protein